MKTLIFLSLLLVSSISHANQGLLDKLKDGGYNIFFRHSITPGPSQNKTNPPHERMGDCSTQRVLNDAGREQAKRIGKIFKENQIPVGEVYSSPFCRCYETAELAFEKYQLALWIIPWNREEQTILNQYLKSIPKNNSNNIFVGHAQTFTEGFVGRPWGRLFLEEGEALIIDPKSQKIIGRIQF